MRPYVRATGRNRYNHPVQGKTHTAVAVFAVGLFALANGIIAGTALPIIPDGSFKEWQGDPLLVDGSGDGRAGGPDLGALYVANDGVALYVRFAVGVETILQNPPDAAAGNALRLLLDLDSDIGTGMPAEGLGADLEVRFGEREILRYSPTGAASIKNPEPLGISSSPTHSAIEFEVRIPFAAAPTKALADRLRGGGDLTFVLTESASGGDRVPDSGTTRYRVSTQPVPPLKATPPAKKLRKRRPFLRLLTFNVQRTTIAEKQAVYRRIARAVAPEIVAFQEVYDWTAGQVERFMDEALPLPDGNRWQAFQVHDTVTVSSYPILAGAGIDDNHAVHIDLPDKMTRNDLVLFNAHTPCCDNEGGRDFEHDRLMVTWRDLLAGSGPFTIGKRDVLILAGDFNMVGYRRQLDVLQHGRFIDPSNGPDFSPSRSKGSLKVADLRHSHARLVHTWRSASSVFSPGRLDYVLYSRDVAKLKKSYTLDTAVLPDEVLEEFGLEAGDSLAASDHLPLVTDFLLKKK